MASSFHHTMCSLQQVEYFELYKEYERRINECLEKFIDAEFPFNDTTKKAKLDELREHVCRIL